MVIRKRSERQGPSDLIHLLTREKQALWEREQNMTLLKIQDETEWAKLVEDVNDDSDEDDEEENFAWYNINDADTYFVLTTMTKQVYKKDDQVFHCYGRRTNQYLLRNYGFALRSNKYNSLKF